MWTKSDAEKLRVAVKNRRGRLRITALQAAEAGTMPLSTWSAIEQGKSHNPKPTTLAGVDEAMRWPPMTAWRVLEGELAPSEAVNLPLDGA